MSIHYFSYPRVRFFFWFFCLTAWRNKHKNNKETKHYAFCVKKKPKEKSKNKSLCFLFLKKKPKEKRKKNQNLCFLF